MLERRILNLSIACAVLFIAASVYLYFFVLPPQIPMFYSLARPQDQLADKIWIFVFPALAVFMGLVQIPFMRVHQAEEHQTTVRVFSLGSIFLLVLLAIVFTRIIFLVT
jgi:hypothetical protein